MAAIAEQRAITEALRELRDDAPGARRRTVSLEALEAADSAELAAEDRAEVLLAVHEALERLAALDARPARVVECCFFGGLTETETAETLGVTARTVTRDRVKARGWLHQELRDDAS